MNLALFGLLAIFWGGSFVAIKSLINDVPSFTSAFYRVFFSVVFLLIIYARKLKIPKGFWGRELAYSSVAGLCSIAIPFALLFWGEQYISPSIAGVLNGTVPFWTLIISIIFFGAAKDISIQKVLGLIVGFTGIALIFGPKISLNGGNSELLGLIAVSGMAISYSIGINLNKTLLSKNTIIDKKLNLVVQQIVSLVFLLLLMLSIEGIPDASLLTKPTNFFSVIYLSLFSTCIAFIIFFKLIHDMGAVQASTVTFFVPPIALFLDAYIYGRQLTMLEGLGSVIILASMLLLKDKVKKAKKPKKTRTYLTPKRHPAKA